MEYYQEEGINPSNQKFVWNYDNELTALDILEQTSPEKREAVKAQLLERIDIELQNQGETRKATEADLNNSFIRAQNIEEIKRGVFEDTVRIQNGAGLHNVVEDRAEGMLKRALFEGKYGVEQLDTWLEEYQNATGDKITLRNGEQLSLSETITEQQRIEGISKIATLYFLGNAEQVQKEGQQVLPLPEGLKDFINFLAKYLKRLFQQVAQLNQAIADGKISEDFEGELAHLSGLDEASYQDFLVKQYQEEALAEIQDETMELQAILGQSLPHPETAKASGEVLIGELDAIYQEHIKAKRKVGKGGKVYYQKSAGAARKLFLPKGEKASLDQLRERLGEDGFYYETPADMLDAILESVQGRPQWATPNPEHSADIYAGAGEGVTFSLDSNKQEGQEIAKSTLERFENLKAIESKAEVKLPDGQGLIDWVLENLAGKKATNPEVGEVEFRARKIRKMYSKKVFPIKFQAIPYLQELIEHAVLLKEDYEGGGKHRKFMAAKFLYQEKEYAARIVLEETKEGQWYYNHEMSDLAEMRGQKESLGGLNERHPQAIRPPRDTRSVLQELLHGKKKEQGGGNSTFSIELKQKDKEYLQAVDAGDMARAQEMVDAAAKSLGYDSPKLFHGTSEKKIIAFDPLKQPNKKGEEGFYFSDSKDTAQTYQPANGKVYEAYLNLKKPLIIDANYKNWDSIHPLSETNHGALRENISVDEVFPSTTREITKKAFTEGGFDSVIYKNVRDRGQHSPKNNPLWGLDSSVYVVKSPSQIKSADPVTYDENGNIIPLSQRFNEADPRISFSLDLNEQEAFANAFAEAQKNKIVNTDDVRPLLKGYKEADPLTRDATFHSQASKVNAKVFEAMLEKKPEKGFVRVLAGGGGSGKSTALASVKGEVDFTLDTTLSHYEGSKKRLEQIKKTGRKARLLYVHRSIEKAIEGNIWRYVEAREQGEGQQRLVPMSALIQAHLGAREAIEKLHQNGYDIEYHWNDGALGEDRTTTLEELKELWYSVDDERQKPQNPSGGERENRPRIYGELQDRSSQSQEETRGVSKNSNGAEISKVPKENRREAQTRTLLVEAENILKERLEDGVLSPREVDAFMGRLKPETSFALEFGSWMDKLDFALAKRLDIHPQERLERLSKARKQLQGLQERFRKQRQGMGASMDATDLVKLELRQSLVSMRAIMSILPAEERGKINSGGNVSRIFESKTDRGRVNALLDLLDKVDSHLKQHLADKYREKIKENFEKAKPKLTDGKNLRGRSVYADEAQIVAAFEAMAGLSEQAKKTRARKDTLKLK